MTNPEPQRSPSTLHAIDPQQISAVETYDLIHDNDEILLIDYLVVVHLAGGGSITTAAETAEEQAESAKNLQAVAVNCMKVSQL